MPPKLPKDALVSAREAGNVIQANASQPAGDDVYRDMVDQLRRQIGSNRNQNGIDYDNGYSSSGKLGTVQWKKVLETVRNSPKLSGDDVKIIDSLQADNIYVGSSSLGIGTADEKLLKGVSQLSPDAVVTLSKEILHQARSEQMHGSKAFGELEKLTRSIDDRTELLKLQNPATRGPSH